MINILSLDIDWIMEPSIQIYNNLINEDSPVEQYNLDIKAPGAILNSDLNKYLQLNRLLFSKQCKVQLQDICITKTHKDIVKAIDCWKINESFSIYNIDHHHDCGYPDTAGDEKYYNRCTCGNWVTYIALNNKMFKHYVWINNINSNTYIDPWATKRLPKMSVSDDINYLSNIKFDKVFICTSPGWIPTNIEPLADALTVAFENFIKL